MRAISAILMVLILSRPAHSLWNGELARPGQFPAAVSYSSCTGVRVGKRHILTAAHCLYEQAKFLRNGIKVDGYLIRDYLAGQRLKINSSIDPKRPKSQELTILKAHIHPSYLEVKSKGDIDLSVDIAIIEFNESLSDTIEVASVLKDLVTKDQSVILAGHGLTAPGIFSREIFFGNMVTSGLSDLLEPLSYGKSRVIQLKPNCYKVAGSGRSEPLEGDLPLLGKGDSGGAVYDPRDPYNLTVIGINSMANILGSGSYIARVDNANEFDTYQWIQNLID